MREIHHSESPLHVDDGSLKVLKDYLKHYIGIQDWHLPAFRLLNQKFSPRRVLYPGSWMHVTPSLVFAYVVYVDAYTQMKRAFNNVNLLQYIKKHAEYRDNPTIKHHKADYRAQFNEEKASFDLLISLSSGFVSQACGTYLKQSGLLSVNNEHYDAS